MLEPIVAGSIQALEGVGHGFFTRAGGVSEGIYASLNCGLGSRDHPSATGQNRARVTDHLGVPPTHLLTCHQFHSAEPVVARTPWTRATMPRADAVITTTPGLAVAVLAADCAPVLFADPEARVIAAAHAGWRGAVSGVLEATVAGMEREGAQRARIRAALGPCIGLSAYEVGPEFEAEVLRLDPGAGPYFARPRPSQRAHFDLPGYVLARLQRMALGSIESCTRCTYGDDSAFFSYRRSVHRGESDYGRQISAIVLS